MIGGLAEVALANNNLPLPLPLPTLPLAALPLAPLPQTSLSVNQQHQTVASAARYPQAGQTLGAVDDYRKLVSELSQQYSAFDARLIEPMIGFGEALLAADAALEANQVFEQALQILRINIGLHHPDQLPLTFRIIDTYLKLDRWQDAHDRRRYAYFVELRQHGKGKLAQAPIMDKMARWYLKTGHLGEARFLYQQIIKAIERYDNKKSPELIPPLLNIAAIYRSQRDRIAMEPREELKGGIGFFGLSGNTIILDRQEGVTQVIQWSQGERSLKRALKLAESDTNNNTLEVIKINIKLGDWHILFDQPQRSYLYYQAAISLLADYPQYQDALGHPFEKPKLLHFPPIEPVTPLRSQSQSLSKREGFIEFSYTVDKRGKTQNSAIVASKPSELNDLLAKKIARLARYRPAFQHLEAVSTPDVKDRYNYFYQASAQNSE